MHPPHAPLRAFDRGGARIEVFDDSVAASWAAADFIARTIAERRAAGRRPVVLGLATGSTPIATYQRLVEMHKDGTTSFAGVATYNLDEYYPIGPLDANSYRSFMHHHLFDGVDLPANRAHVLDGTVPEHAVASACRAFDDWIAADGGLDLQLLGIGRNGHIGFNEPTDVDVDRAADLPTRLVELHPTTTADAARDFGGSESDVPRRALTMGTRTILSAASVLVLAFGAKKAEVVARAIDGEPTGRLPASLLRLGRGRVTWMLDPEAATGLAP